MNKLQAGLLLIIMSSSTGCSSVDRNFLSTDDSRPVIASVDPMSKAYLADENGQKIVTEKYPDGLEVFLGDDAKIIIESRYIKSEKPNKYIWEYVLIMLLVFVSLLVTMYVWEKFKRR